MVKSISENALKNNKEAKTQPPSALQPVHAVILVGFMGAGKSTVGRALAARLGWAFEDLDESIERRENLKIAAIFRERGESAFRKAEHAALRELLEEVRRGSEKIIALGGGAFIQQSNAILIDAAHIPTVFLDATVDELWARCLRQSREHGMERPLLGSWEDFCRLHGQRLAHYRRASMKQETGGRTISEIVADLIQSLNLEPRGENE